MKQKVFLLDSQGCYLDECQWLALVQMDSGTYTGDTESLEWYFQDQPNAAKSSKVGQISDFLERHLYECHRAALIMV